MQNQTDSDRQNQTDVAAVRFIIVFSHNVTIYGVLPCFLNGGVLERCKSLTTRRFYILRLGCLPLTADFTIMCPFEWEAEMLGTGFSTSGKQKGDGYPSRMLRPSL